MYAAFTSICRLQALGAAEGCCYHASDDPGLSITDRRNRVGVGAGVGVGVGVGRPGLGGFSVLTRIWLLPKRVRHAQLLVWMHKGA